MPRYGSLISIKPSADKKGYHLICPKTLIGVIFISYQIQLSTHFF